MQSLLAEVAMAQPPAKLSLLHVRRAAVQGSHIMIDPGIKGTLDECKSGNNEWDRSNKGNSWWTCEMDTIKRLVYIPLYTAGQVNMSIA